VVATATADASGNFTFPATAALTDGKHTFEVVAKDAAGNSSQPSAPVAMTIDTTPPAAPALTGFGVDTGVKGDGRTEDSTPAISGTAEPGSLVKIYDNGKLVGQGYADANGNFTIPVGPLANGPHDLKATATDAAGNTGPLSNSLPILIENASGTAAPVITGLGDDTGKQGDGVTADRTQTVVGTALPGALVDVYVDGQKVDTVLADGQGNWTCTVPALADGEHTFVAVQMDPATGKASLPSNQVGTTIDATAPAAPVFTSFSQDTGKQGDGVTADNTITMTGLAEPGSTVTIYDNGQPIGTVVAGPDGVFTFTTQTLPDGSHAFSATATDDAGNTSPESGATTWVIDTTPPAAPTVISVGEDTGIKGDQITSDNTLTVTGKAEPGSTVRLYDNGVLVGEAVADANGDYTITTGPLADGQHPLTVTATDASGNTSAPMSAGTWTIDTSAPAAPVITGVGEDTGVKGDGKTADDTITIDGKGEPGSTITIYDNGQPIGTAQVDGNGNWSFTTPPLDDGNHSFSAAQTDKNGNSGPASDPVNMEVDTTPPSAPGVISVSIDTANPSDKVTSDNTLTVTGTAEPGSTVKIYDLVNGKLVLVGEGVADANGRYTVTTVPLADGQHPLSISATDASGNQSGLTQLGTWTIDTTAPAAPVITGYGQDTGTSPDGFTEDTDLFLVGTAEPNSVVEVFDGDRLLGVVTADAQGKWRLDSTGLLDRSTHRFTARATDTAGNVGPLSNPLDVTVTVPLAASGSQSMAFTVARPESHPVNVTGGTGPMTYQLVPGKGDLPEGLSLNPLTGVISGVPVKLSMGTVQVLVTDRYGHTVPVTVSIKVEAAEKPLLVSSGIGTNTNVGQIPEGLINPMTFEAGTAVTLYDTADFKPSGQAVPFVGYKGEVRISLDDIDGNGVPDIVAAAGLYAQPHVRVLDIETGVSKMSFLAFDAAYRGGLYVSTGDINGDNQKDIVVASGIGARSHIKVFDGKTGSEIASFFAFEEGFTGGSTVAVGDTDGDGIAEIVVGKGPGSEPLVRIFEQKNGAWGQRAEFLAFERFFRGGVYVAVGDIGGDGRIEIAVGANAGASAAVAVYNAKTTEHLDQFYAYGQVDNVGPFGGGARVTIEDYNRDGKADLITGAGPGSYPHLRVWDLTDLSQIASLLVAEDNYKGGVNLG